MAGVTYFRPFPASSTSAPCLRPVTSPFHKLIYETAMARKPAGNLVLTRQERQQLEAWARQGKTAQTLAARARIVLACAEGRPMQAVALRHKVAVQTVTKWRARFIRLRLQGLADAPRQGAPKTVDASRIEAVIAQTLEGEPPNGLYWTTRGLAQTTGESVATIFRIWRSFGLQPRLQDRGGPWGDPDMLERLRGLVGIHIDPPLRALALCLSATPDQSASVGKSGRKTKTAPVRPPPARARAAHDLTNLLHLAVGDGADPGNPHRYNSALLEFLKTVNRHVPKSHAILILLEQRNVRLSPAVQRWLFKQPRISVRQVPSLAAWLYSWKRILDRLAAMGFQLNDEWTEARRPQGKKKQEYQAGGSAMGWIKSADDIQASLSEYQLRIFETG